MDEDEDEKEVTEHDLFGLEDEADEETGAANAELETPPTSVDLIERVDQKVAHYLATLTVDDAHEFHPTMVETDMGIFPHSLFDVLGHSSRGH